MIQRRRDNRLVIERHMPITGNTVRAVVEPAQAEEGYVRIVEYRRKRPDQEQFMRVRDEEGAICHFDQLGIEGGFEDWFKPN